MKRPACHNTTLDVAISVMTLVLSIIGLVFATMGIRLHVSFTQAAKDFVDCEQSGLECRIERDCLTYKVIKEIK